MNKPVILIVGPTASGKTDLSIAIAKQFNGECINADATQIFNGLDIATNKITKAEQENIPHHLLSIIDLNDSYSINKFQIMGREIINEIWNRGKTPIIVGGSGLYINALLKDYHFPKEDNQVHNVQSQYDNYSNQELWNHLLSIDPAEAQKTHYNNRKRVLRAITYYGQNHQLKSNNNTARNSWFYRPYIIGLNPIKAELHKKIKDRVLKLTDRGLFQEVKTAYDYCQHDISKQSMKIIGCKEIISYFNQNISYDECLEQMVKANKRYAKKQLTWFRHQLTNVKWYSYSYQNFNEVIQAVINDLQNLFK